MLVVIIAATLIGTGALRAIFGAAAVLFALAVGVSRVYLGDHYPTDVLGSYLTVAATVLLVAAVTDLPRIRVLGARLHLRAREPVLRAGLAEEPATVKLDHRALGRPGLPPPPPPRPHP